MNPLNKMIHFHKLKSLQKEKLSSFQICYECLRVINTYHFDTTCMTLIILCLCLFFVKNSILRDRTRTSAKSETECRRHESSVQRFREARHQLKISGAKLLQNPHKFGKVKVFWSVTQTNTSSKFLALNKLLQSPHKAYDDDDDENNNDNNLLT